ncbi:MAG: hypothetical protein K1X94_16280 [Sandaracinaceae bacterium]|nr:hypothetical protein [Sandaracinaceae bacterium]
MRERELVADWMRELLDRGAASWSTGQHDDASDVVRAIVWLVVTCAIDDAQLSGPRCEACAASLGALAASLDPATVAAIRDELWQQPWEDLEGTLAFIARTLRERRLRELGVSLGVRAAMAKPLSVDHGATLLWVASELDVLVSDLLEIVVTEAEPDAARVACVLLASVRCAELLAPDGPSELRAQLETLASPAATRRASELVALGVSHVVGDRAPESEATRDAATQLEAALATIVVMGRGIDPTRLRLEALHSDLGGNAGAVVARVGARIRARAWGSPMKDALAKDLRDPALRRQALFLATRAALCSVIEERGVSDLVELALSFDVGLDELRRFVRECLVPAARCLKEMAILERAFDLWETLHVGLRAPRAWGPGWARTVTSSQPARDVLARGIDDLRAGRRQRAGRQLASALGLGLVVARAAGAQELFWSAVADVSDGQLLPEHLRWVSEALVEGDHQPIRRFARQLQPNAPLRALGYALALRVALGSNHPYVVLLLQSVARELGMTAAETEPIVRAVFEDVARPRA